MAGIHYQKLRQYEPQGKEGLLDAFESWLMARFKNSEEVRQMIVDIPPIEKSAAARYFRQQGQEIGEKLGEKRGEIRGEKRGEMRGEKRGEKRGAKRGEKQGEIKAIQSQIARLKKRQQEMSPQLYQDLMTPLEARLAQLGEKQ